MSAADRRPADDAVRQRIARDLGATLFVEAAAGTGKTTVLVSRIVAVLASGAGSLEGIVAVTFTEKAAGELKLRLREGIEKARLEAEGGSEPRRLLDAALAELEAARIGTIHAFCAELLRERPVEAGVDPLFDVASGDESRALLDQVFDSWFQRVLSDPPEGVRRVLRRRPAHRSDPGPRDRLRMAVSDLAEHRDFDAAWRREPFERAAEIDAILDGLARLEELAGRPTRPGDYLAQNLAHVARFLEQNRQRERVRGRDHDALEAGLSSLAGRKKGWHWRGYGSEYSAGLGRDAVVAVRDSVKAELDRFLERAEADLAACLREELRPVIRDYEAWKARAGKLDFLDLLLRARNLVRDDATVRALWQERTTHFFVDEFQDTDPLQAELLVLLAANAPGESDWLRVAPIPGKLFCVGDPKQSIYRFRRADVAIYEAVKARLSARGAEVVHLTTSFRARPAIQQAINAAFAASMTGSSDGSQAAYVALEPWRDDRPEQPAVVALPVPDPYSDYGKVVHWQIEKSLPQAVGAFVDWLVHASGWQVQEKGELKPVEPRHVCLLFRRFRSFRDDVTGPYVQALEARGLPHVLVGGLSFHDREEVLALRNALAAVEWPDDELRVFATLRGPLFALADDALLAFRHRFHTLHPLVPLDLDALSESEREVAEALCVLAALHRERNRRSLALTVGRLLDAVRAHAGIAIWPTGQQALANCLRVVDLARRFEQSGVSSFRSFVERLDRAAEQGSADDAPAVEEGTEGVRIMTVHRAKGLEFPVVVLVDPTCRATREPPMRHVDPERRLWAEPLCGAAPLELIEHREDEARRDRDEATRVAYVAATRARDLLVVPVVGDEEVEGWLDVLNPVLYPELATRRQPAKAPGCPEFGADSVRKREERSRRGASSSVAPGSHRPRRGTHGVAWWDPAILDLEKRQEIGLRQQRILEADDGTGAGEESLAEHDAWQTARRERWARGGVASLHVEAVTALAERSAGAAESGDGSRGEAGNAPPPISIEEIPARGRARPAGKRFGTLVHAMLAAIDLDADAGAIQAIAANQGRLVGAGAEEVHAAAGAVEAALAHSLLVRARAAAVRGWLRRETPVWLAMQDGALAEGHVDLAFREERADGEGVWTVVDFKTDQEIGARRATYAAQVAFYVQGVARATGERAEGLLLIV